jgi:hypothetical protein
MSGYELEAKAIEEYFDAAWLAGTESAVPLIYENSGVVPPADFPYIAFKIKPVSGSQLNLGLSSLDRFIGMVFADIIVPVSTGDRRGREISDVVMGILTRAQLTTDGGDSIIFRTASLSQPGAMDEKFLLSVSCSFHRNRIS